MGEIGWPEILIVILVLVLLFGAKKLPELARGSGRAIRIFKSETKGLMDDDEDDADPAAAPKQLNQTTPPAAAPPQQTDTGQAPPPAPPMHTEN